MCDCANVCVAGAAERLTHPHNNTLAHSLNVSILESESRLTRPHVSTEQVQRRYGSNPTAPRGG